MKIFISYSSNDSDRLNIEEIARELESKPNIERVFYWERDTGLGQNFDDYMINNIANSDFVLLFCSPQSEMSRPVMQEIGMAKQARKTIIPVCENDSDVY